MANMGQEEFDYDSFKLTYDTDPTIKTIVHRFDQNGIELKSKSTDEINPTADDESSAEKVHKTAVKAARRHMA